MATLSLAELCVFGLSIGIVHSALHICDDQQKSDNCGGHRSTACSYQVHSYHNHYSHEYFCTCAENYVGRMCQYNACSGINHCQNNGQCYQGHTHKHCYCGNTDYVGNTCEYRGCSAHQHCHSHGTCYIADDGQNKCWCSDSRFGDNCEFGKCNDQSYCSNQGTCYHDRNDHHRKCSCEEGFTGAQCELARCHQGADFCHGNGYCYRDNSDDKCKCFDGFFGNRCEKDITLTNTATTTTTMTATTTTTTQPTTTVYIGYLHCNKYSAVADLAHTAPVTNQNAPECVHSHSHASSEALVMHDCNVTTPDTWRKGQKVWGNCASIPAYTAIGTFVMDTFQTGQGLAGVFLECIPNGFKVAIQTCDQSPKIMHFEAGGVGLLDPEMYFTIQ